MSWFGKITFGMIGLVLGGPLGAIAGASIGHVMVDKKISNFDHGYQRIPGPEFESSEFEPVEKTQAAYFISLFSILGKMSKIDGVVTKDEIKVVQNVINRLSMVEDERKFARRVFNEAKNSMYTIEDFASQLHRIIHNQPTLVISFFNLLFEIAAADGRMHQNEENALKSVQSIFRISDRQYDNIKAVYFGNIDKHYRVLNCTPNSTNEEIKSNYKKLVKDFHPDKIISKGLPEEFVEFAEGRFREIQESYEIIAKERGI